MPDSLLWSTAPAAPSPQLSPPAENIPHNSPKLPVFEHARSVTRPPSARPFTARQEAALTLLALGKSEPEVRLALGIDRKTLYNWRRKNPRFAAELAHRQAHVWDTAATRLQHALLRSV